MKILLISSFFPYPLYSGGQVRLYNLLRSLGKKHEITLISEIRSDFSHADLKRIEPYCKRIYTVTRPKQWSLSNILKCGFSLLPFLLVGHKNTAMTKIIADKLQTGKFDLIHVETFYVMHNLPKNTLPVILAEHNIEYEVYKKWVDHFKYFFLKPLLYFDVLKLAFWEKYFWKKATKVVVVSQEDQGVVQKIAKKTDVVGNGVDTDYFKEIIKHEPKIPTIVFAGSFKWMQNVDAAKYLITSLWPKIKESVADVSLWIVGNNATEYIKSDDNRIVITDSVEDIREVYSKSTLLLAPIRIGGGTKFKILESMASGLPIVTTPSGVEGLGNNTNGIIVAQKEEDLITATVKLLKDEKRRLAISKNELIFVRKYFDWAEISQKLDIVYSEI